MSWLSLVIGIISLLRVVTETLARKRMISDVEADVLLRVLQNDKAVLEDVRKARAVVRADIDAGRLRDDDGHRRD